MKTPSVYKERALSKAAMSIVSVGGSGASVVELLLLLLLLLLPGAGAVELLLLLLPEVGSSGVASCSCQSSSSICFWRSSPISSCDKSNFFSSLSPPTASNSACASLLGIPKSLSPAILPSPVKSSNMSPLSAIGASVGVAVVVGLTESYVTTSVIPLGCSPFMMIESKAPYKSKLKHRNFTFSIERMLECMISFVRWSSLVYIMEPQVICR
mmetsp:Transcript_11735/g.19353  ORF Transcript_11735/g.19353 Transcript_11735/m.19353 type:complete len:212 (+) Transcript_11735:102-737(+)